MNDCLWIWLNCEINWFWFWIIELLTVFWIFFTWFQLVNPANKLRIEYRSFFRSWYVYTLVISVLFCVVPIVLNFIPGKSLPVIWYDIFREVLSIFFALFTGIVLFLQAIIPIRRVNTKKFAKILANYIWGEEKDISAVSEEFQYFIRDIIKKVDKWDINACRIVLLCKNTVLVRKIVCNIGGFDSFINVYLEREKDEKIYEKIQIEFVQFVINSSLNCDNSILAREIQWDLFWWFNGWKWLISKKIFDDFFFIHRYHLLSWRDDFVRFDYNLRKSKTFWKNFCSFLKLAINAFFCEGREYDDKKNNLKDNLKDNIQYHKDLYIWLNSLCWYDGILYNRLTWYPAVEIISLVSKYNDIIEEYYKNKDLKFYECEESLWFSPVINPDSLMESISWWIYRMIETIWMIKETEENSFDIRQECIHLYDHFWWKDKTIVNIIHDNIKNLMYGQIKFVNSRGYYPNMTRAFFHIFWYSIFDDKLEENDRDFVLKTLIVIHDSLKRFAKWEFWYVTKKFIDIQDTDIIETANNKARETIDNFLPNNMEYSTENDTLTYYFSSNLSKSVLDCKRLEKGEIIILDRKKKK